MAKSIAPGEATGKAAASAGRRPRRAEAASPGMRDPARRDRQGLDEAEPLAEMVMRLGRLELRLARNEAEIDAAQALRYRVFYEEMGARPSEAVQRAQRDFDPFDAICDHLLVLDHSQGEPQVVGTYRLIRRSVADAHGGFYSAQEYDLGPILAYPGEILELGRSCVDIDFRFRPTMQLLWKGIAAYIYRHDIPLMFGCASLPGTDPQRLAAPLSFLYWHHLAPPALRPVALPERRVDMALMQSAELDPRQAIGELPPLIKGYMRLGGFVGEGAVIDDQFNTTDVCVVVKTDTITGKYTKHYGRMSRDAEPGGGEPALEMD